MRPGVTALTRTLGAHSTASDCVRWMSPALAAPYATVPGDGRRPLTLAMLRITPPDGCACMTALARCAQKSGASRLRCTTAVEKCGEAGAVPAGGPAARCACRPAGGAPTPPD